MSKEASKDLFVAVMGVTGSGKSTFISHCTDELVPVSDSMKSCTQEVRVYNCRYNDRTNVKLVDTPGFDDTDRSDVQVLREIASWLTASYSSQIKLRGIVLLHRISDRRMPGSGRRNLLMFRKLVGADALDHVILTTTMWENVIFSDGLLREKELEETPEFWGYLVEKGSKMERHTNDRESAMRILSMFVPIETEMSDIVVDLQRQMVDQGKDLRQTEAGIELETELVKERLKFEKEKAALLEDWKDAKREHDEETAKELRLQREEMDKELERLNGEQKKLEKSMQEEHHRKFSELQAQLVAAMTQADQRERQRDRTIEDLGKQLTARKEQEQEQREQIEALRKEIQAIQMNSTPEAPLVPDVSQKPLHQHENAKHEEPRQVRRQRQATQASRSVQALESFKQNDPVDNYTKYLDHVEDEPGLETTERRFYGSNTTRPVAVSHRIPPVRTKSSQTTAKPAYPVAATSMESRTPKSWSNLLQRINPLKFEPEPKTQLVRASGHVKPRESYHPTLSPDYSTSIATVSISGDYFAFCGTNLDLYRLPAEFGPWGDKNLVMLGEKGSWIRIGFKQDVPDPQYGIFHSPHFNKEYPGLLQWLFAASSSVHESLFHWFIALGANGTWYAHYGSQHCFDPGKSSAFNSFKPELVAAGLWLGANDAWIKQDLNGSLTWDLKGGYKVLDIELQWGTSRGDLPMAIAMNLQDDTDHVIVWRDVPLHIVNQGRDYRRSDMAAFVKGNDWMHGSLINHEEICESSD